MLFSNQQIPPSKFPFHHFIFFQRLSQYKDCIYGSSFRPEPIFIPSILTSFLIRFSNILSIFLMLCSKINTFVTSTRSNISFCFVDWYRVSPSPASGIFFLEAVLQLPLSTFLHHRFCTLSTIQMFTPLGPAAFPAFMRFGVFTTAFTDTLS